MLLVFNTSRKLSRDIFNCDNLLRSSCSIHLHVHRDLPALSGCGEAEQQQCGKVIWGFPHWAPE